MVPAYCLLNYMRFFRIFLILIAVLFIFGCSQVPDTEPETEPELIIHNYKMPVELDSTVLVEKIYSADCIFPEDGSFDNKSDVLSLEISNVSKRMLRLARIFVLTDKKEYVFEITTLPADAKMIVFEKNASSLSSDETIINIRIENAVFFENEVSLHSDLFEITEFDKVMNIRNISGVSSFSDIYVYFKKVTDDGKFMGGITFRAKVSGLMSGELKQVAVPNFSIDDSEVMFVEYAEI